MKILILATSKPSQKLIDAIEKRGHTYYWLQPKNTYLFVSESINGYDRVYNISDETENEPKRLLLKNFDCVISRIGNDLKYGANVLSHLVHNLGLFCPQTPQGLLWASDKMKTTQLLSEHGIRVPATVFAKKPIHVDFLIKKIGGLPAVGKTVTGSQGKGVFILKDPEQTNTTLDAMYHNDMDILLQKYIDANATDIRAIVVDNEVVASMTRTGKNSFKANLSQGGSGQKVNLSNEDKQLCVNSAHAVGLRFAGVDIMKDKDGKSYCIEVNGNPGIKSIEITGVNWFVNLVQFLEREIKDNSKEKTVKEAAALKGVYETFNLLSTQMTKTPINN